VPKRGLDLVEIEELGEGQRLLERRDPLLLLLARLRDADGERIAADSSTTRSGSMPGSGTSMLQPSSVLFT
jgi:hypothetical protein